MTNSNALSIIEFVKTIRSELEVVMIVMNQQNQFTRDLVKQLILSLSSNTLGIELKEAMIKISNQEAVILNSLSIIQDKVNVELQCQTLRVELNNVRAEQATYQKQINEFRDRVGNRLGLYTNLPIVKSPNLNTTLSNIQSLIDSVLSYTKQSGQIDKLLAELSDAKDKIKVFVDARTKLDKKVTDFEKMSLATQAKLAKYNLIEEENEILRKDNLILKIELSNQKRQNQTPQNRPKIPRRRKKPVSSGEDETGDEEAKEGRDSGISDSDDSGDDEPVERLKTVETITSPFGEDSDPYFFYNSDKLSSDVIPSIHLLNKFRRRKDNLPSNDIVPTVSIKSKEVVISTDVNTSRDEILFIFSQLYNRDGSKKLGKTYRYLITDYLQTGTNKQEKFEAFILLMSHILPVDKSDKIKRNNNSGVIDISFEKNRISIKEEWLMWEIWCAILQYSNWMTLKFDIPVEELNLMRIMIYILCRYDENYDFDTTEGMLRFGFKSIRLAMLKIYNIDKNIDDHFERAQDLPIYYLKNPNYVNNLFVTNGSSVLNLSTVREGERVTKLIVSRFITMALLFPLKIVYIARSRIIYTDEKLQNMIASPDYPSNISIEEGPIMDTYWKFDQFTDSVMIHLLTIYEATIGKNNHDLKTVTQFTEDSKIADIKVHFHDKKGNESFDDIILRELIFNIPDPLKLKRLKRYQLTVFKISSLPFYLSTDNTTFNLTNDTTMANNLFAHHITTILSSIVQNTPPSKDSFSFFYCLSYIDFYIGDQLGFNGSANSNTFLTDDTLPRKMMDYRNTSLTLTPSVLTFFEGTWYKKKIEEIESLNLLKVPVNSFLDNTTKMSTPDIETIVKATELILTVVLYNSIGNGFGSGWDYEEYKTLIFQPKFDSLGPTTIPIGIANIPEGNKATSQTLTVQTVRANFTQKWLQHVLLCKNSLLNKSSRLYNIWSMLDFNHPIDFTTFRPSFWDGNGKVASYLVLDRCGQTTFFFENMLRQNQHLLDYGPCYIDFDGRIINNDRPLYIHSIDLTLQKRYDLMDSFNGYNEVISQIEEDSKHTMAKDLISKISSGLGPYYEPNFFPMILLEYAFIHFGIYQILLLMVARKTKGINTPIFERLELFFTGKLQISTPGGVSQNLDVFIANSLFVNYDSPEVVAKFKTFSPNALIWDVAVNPGDEIDYDDASKMFIESKNEGNFLSFKNKYRTLALLEYAVYKFAVAIPNGIYLDVFSQLLYLLKCKQIDNNKLEKQLNLTNVLIES